MITGSYPHVAENLAGQKAYLELSQSEKIIYNKDHLLPIERKYRGLQKAHAVQPRLLFLRSNAHRKETISLAILRGPIGIEHYFL
jgi:hypothetical protein